jgi:hypothetical protein
VASQVRVASALRDKLAIIPGAVDALVEEFAAWKSSGEDDHYDFGKDGLGLGTKVLFHVHMVPLNVPEDHERWDKAWKRHGRRTSDRYLFHAFGGARLGWLLLDIVDDPGAHKVWDPEHRAVRAQLEAWAEAFTATGRLPD